MTHPRKKAAPPFGIPSGSPVFRLDKSQIPVDKLDDPRLAEWEEAIVRRVQYENYRSEVCPRQSNAAQAGENGCPWKEAR
jgi:hypothetical protein